MVPKVNLKCLGIASDKKLKLILKIFVAIAIKGGIY
jgi:hypothetical protein